MKCLDNTAAVAVKFNSDVQFSLKMNSNDDTQLVFVVPSLCQAFSFVQCLMTSPSASGAMWQMLVC